MIIIIRIYFNLHINSIMLWIIKYINYLARDDKLSKINSNYSKLFAYRTIS